MVKVRIELDVEDEYGEYLKALREDDYGMFVAELLTLLLKGFDDYLVSLDLD